MFKQSVRFSFLLCGLLVLGIPQAHSFELKKLFKDRSAELQAAVDTAHSIVLYFEKQAKEGHKTSEQAQKEAIDILRAARYQNTEYFWITDLDTNVIMHGVKPALEGKNLKKFKDQNGKLFFKEITDLINKNPEQPAIIEYVWPKAGAEKFAKKISYSKLTPEWNWIVTSSLYKN
jgi:methyl-accepting chemotaxis protein